MGGSRAFWGKLRDAEVPARNGGPARLLVCRLCLTGLDASENRRPAEIKRVKALAVL